MILLLLLHLSLLGNRIGDDLGKFAARYSDIACYPEGFSDDAPLRHLKICTAPMVPGKLDITSTWLRAEFSDDDKLQELTVYLEGNRKDATRWVQGFTKSYGPPESEFVTPPSISDFWEVGGQFLAVHFSDKITNGLGHDIITLSLSAKKVKVAE